MMRSRRSSWLSFCLALVLWTPAAGAQSTTSSLFDRLVGHWELKGTIDGKQTVHDVDAEFVLNRGYVRLHEVSREKNKAGSPEYEAIVFISRDKTGGDFSCLWLDNTSAAGLSASGIVHAKPTDTSLPFIFNIGKDHVFRTTFIYSAKADTWEWRMDDDTNGKLAPFARVTLSRRH